MTDKRATDMQTDTEADLREALRLIFEWRYSTPDHVQRAIDSDALLTRHGLAKTYPDET